MFEGYSKGIKKAQGQDDTLHFLYGNGTYLNSVSYNASSWWK